MTTAIGGALVQVGDGCCPASLTEGDRRRSSRCRLSLGATGSLVLTFHLEKLIFEEVFGCLGKCVDPVHKGLDGVLCF